MPAASSCHAGAGVGRVAAAILAACNADVAHLKPGNVSRFCGGHAMLAADFLASAQSAAGPLCRPGSTLGERVLGAVRASLATAGCNTNLGIVLLCAPLAMAGEAGGDGGLGADVRAVLAAADLEDCRRICAAIAAAAPGGLASAPAHDVNDAIDAPLDVVMGAAADRDLIARQYSNGFADLLGPMLDCWSQCHGEAFAVARLFLFINARWPDSHVSRRHGASAALDLQARMKAVEKQLVACKNARSAAAVLYEADADLKRGGINPGTSADLTVATMMAGALDRQIAIPG